MSWRGASWNWKKFSPVPETGLKTKNTVHTVGRIYITVWTVFFMDRKLKIWEMALLFGVLCAIMGGMWLDREQTQLANQVIRLHVIANSDSDGDQALKLKVRDGVLAQAEQLYPKGASLEQAAQALERNLAVLAAAGMDCADVVKTTVFLADMGDFAAVNAIYAQYFPGEAPARSCVQVAALPKGAQFEIEAVAVK